MTKFESTDVHLFACSNKCRRHECSCKALSLQTMSYYIILICSCSVTWHNHPSNLKMYERLPTCKEDHRCAPSRSGLKNKHCFRQADHYYHEERKKTLENSKTILAEGTFGSVLALCSMTSPVAFYQSDSGIRLGFLREHSNFRLKGSWRVL